MRIRTNNSRRKQRGVVIFLFATAMTTVLLATALAVDLGIAHVTFGKLAKAVDAAALAGARYAASKKGAVDTLAQRVAIANFGTGETMPARYFVNVTTPSTDTYQVTVTGKTKVPTMFATLLNKPTLDVVAVAEAVRYPLDLTLVLDLSQSLERAGAFDELQTASKNFIERFDDGIDQVGIVGYSTWASDLMGIRKNFKAPGNAAIDDQVAISDTNIEEGLRLGKRQLDGAPTRENAIKVAVLFTDGRPTAFADALRLDGSNNDCGAAPDPLAFNRKGLKDGDGDGTPDCWGGAVSAYISGSSTRGLFTADTGRKVTGFLEMVPSLTSNLSSTSSPLPLRLPGGHHVSGDGIRALGYSQSEEWANAIRTAGYTVYCVGLGDPDGAAGDVPDLAFLRRLANEDGSVNASQPIGEMLFSPSAADLDATFSRLADRILVRLTR